MVRINALPPLSTSSICKLRLKFYLRLLFHIRSYSEKMSIKNSGGVNSPIIYCGKYVSPIIYLRFQAYCLVSDYLLPCYFCLKPQCYRLFFTQNSTTENKNSRKFIKADFSEDA